MNRVLITGGGFVRSHVTELLVREGCRELGYQVPETFKRQQSEVERRRR